MEKLLAEIRMCQLCDKHLPHGPRPVLQASENSRILIVGQAPGKKVHETGVPWDDSSGDKLRQWLGVDKLQFYNPELFALVPMGFCYPGAGKTGDLPPRPECAPAWHRQVLDFISHIRLTLLIGQYAQTYYLKGRVKQNLTETVRCWREYAGENVLPLPHPSPLNFRWQAKNKWFETELAPEIAARVAAIV